MNIYLCYVKRLISRICRKTQDKHRKIIKSHYEKNTLTWKNRDIIIQDIVEDMGKVNGAQTPEMKYMDSVLIHFLLYNKRNALSDLV